MNYDLDKAHKFASNNMQALKSDRICGCFYCISIFAPKEIKEWIIADNPSDKHGTAVCPHCGVDSVIGESSGFPITKEFLQAMYQRWFGQ